MGSSCAERVARRMLHPAAGFEHDDMPNARQAGDESELFRAHHEALVQRVHRSLRVPHAVAEDACSIAWIQLLRTQPDRTSVFGWLCVVATREAIRLCDRERRALPLESLSPGERAIPAARPFGSDLADDLVSTRHALEALAGLPERQREAFARLLAGYSHAEIAAATGASRRTVERLLVRARARLRQVERGEPTVAAA